MKNFEIKLNPHLGKIVTVFQISLIVFVARLFKVPIHSSI